MQTNHQPDGQSAVARIDPAPDPRAPWRWWWFAAGAAALVVGILAAMGRLPLVPSRAQAKGEEKKVRDPVVVTIASVTARPLRRTVPMVGTLQGFDQVTITPKVEGQVTAIYHEVGHVVRPDEPLLQVDRTNYENAVDEAEKALGAELAKINLALADQNKQRPDVRKLPAQVRGQLNRLAVKELPAVVRAARAEQLALSQRNRLVKLGANVTEEELERARTEYDVAVANHRQAVVEAEANVAAARQRLAALETALQRLDDTTVVVPHPNDESLLELGETTAARKAADANGSPRSKQPRAAQPNEYVVAKKLVVVGTMVRSFPSVPVFELVRDYELKLMGSLPERYIGKIEQPRAGQPPQRVSILTEGYHQVFEGRVHTVSPVVDTTSRTFAVEVRVPNPDRKIKAGSFAKARILAREETSVLTVPEEAIVRFAGVIKVFVAENGQSRAVEVSEGARLEAKVGERTTTWIEVTPKQPGALPVGASVVTSGHSQLAEGTAVKVRGNTEFGMRNAE